MQNNILWYLSKLAYTQLIPQYAQATYMMLYWEESIAVWRSMHYVGHYVIAAVLILGAELPPRYKASRLSAPNAAQAPSAMAVPLSQQ